MPSANQARKLVRQKKPLIIVLRKQKHWGLNTHGQEKQQERKQIPPLRCGMTNKKGWGVVRTGKRKGQRQLSFADC
jgi:hypothetical protein